MTIPIRENLNIKINILHWNIPSINIFKEKFPELLKKNELINCLKSKSNL